MKQYMSLREIQELIKFLNKSNVSEISIERENFKITLRTHSGNAAAPALPPVSAPVNYPVLTPAAQPAAAPTMPQPNAEASKAETSDSSKYITIKSPMIGTFYRSSSPDKPTFVNVGDEIKTGDVLCVIEAMKLFNEIESEHTGRVVKILVENAKPVEYDQPLFLLEPM